MMTGMVQDQSMEKQMEKQMAGCMAGFFHIFDRPNSLPPKRLVSPKRRLLPPPSPSSDTATEADINPRQPQQLLPRSSPSRDILSPLQEPGTPSEAAPKSPLPFPLFEFKEGTRSPWKFSKEAPRLSLDSRATTDARGGLYPRGSSAELSGAGAGTAPGGETERQRRSPSVVARLMGLDNLPGSGSEPGKNAELRRSASESRVDKDVYRFIKGCHFQPHEQLHQPPFVPGIVIREEAKLGDAKLRSPKPDHTPKMQPRGSRLGHRKSFYDSADFFPEPTKQSASIYNEIERRLRIRGINEPSKDLENLKQILDALQLKGLLHSKRPPGGEFHLQRNFVHEPGLMDSPIVLMRPSNSRLNNKFESRSGDESMESSLRSRPRPALVRRSSPSVAREPSIGPRRDNAGNQNRGRSASTISPSRSDNGTKSPIRRKPTSDAEPKRISPVRRQPSPNRSPKTPKPASDIYPAEDDFSTVSESSVSTPPQTDTERSRSDECNEVRSLQLLERCGKLLDSIAEMTATPGDLQPSPVSVLDASSFYKDESSPSPVTMKRNIEFTQDDSGEFDDDPSSVISYKPEENTDGTDFVYVSDILRARSYLPDESDVFLLLEKQQYLKGNDTSKASRLQRRLIYDTITEILERRRRFPPQCGADAGFGSAPTLQQIWSEFQTIRERDASEEDLFEIICGVLKKDLITGDTVAGWGKCPVEVSETVLDIERLIFKDLISETIHNHAAAGAELANRPQELRRRLVF